MVNCPRRAGEWQNLAGIDEKMGGLLKYWDISQDLCKWVVDGWRRHCWPQGCFHSVSYSMTKIICDFVTISKITLPQQSTKFSQNYTLVTHNVTSKR